MPEPEVPIVMRVQCPKCFATSGRFCYKQTGPDTFQPLDIPHPERVTRAKEALELGKVRDEQNPVADRVLGRVPAGPTFPPARREHSPEYEERMVLRRDLKDRMFGFIYGGGGQDSKASEAAKEIADFDAETRRLFPNEAPVLHAGSPFSDRIRKMIRDAQSVPVTELSWSLPGSDQASMPEGKTVDPSEPHPYEPSPETQAEIDRLSKYVQERYGVPAERIERLRVNQSFQGAVGDVLAQDSERPPADSPAWRRLRVAKALRDRFGDQEPGRTYEAYMGDADAILEALDGKDA